MKTRDQGIQKEAEWRRRSAIFVTALLLFETVTGLLIYFLPFSVASQMMVLIHTGAGLMLLLPYTWYQVSHWVNYRSQQLNYLVLTGYLSAVSTFVACISGFVLTYQAAFGTRIESSWDLVHIISTFALIASLLPHILPIIYRTIGAKQNDGTRLLLDAQKYFGARVSFLALTLLVLIAVGTYLYKPVSLNNELPKDYVFLYGDDRPFAPSLAQTRTGNAFDARSLGGSQACGVPGCHVEIVKEWEVSAHRWSAMDPAFRAIQQIMGEQNGRESTRYCGGCHDPISLFAGTKNLYSDELTNPIGFDEGVSCITCHGIKETDVKGNANYVIDQPERYLFEMEEGRPAQWLSYFLIRAYPEQHIESLQHRLFKSPEFCASCHKQFIDEEINNVGWVQLQNQYDNWRNSRWNHPGDPEKTIECRECHMPLTPSFDPASGDDLDYNRTADDGKHRSHRFLGANQFVPVLLDLPGAQEQVDMVGRWLKGKFEIPEISSKWNAGPAVPIELITPATAEPGQNVDLEVVITNNKVGHDFPTGPLDIIQAWVELRVTDDEGRLVFSSGERDDEHFIETGSFMFKAEPVDQYGNLIDRHNLWEMVGVRYRRSLFPGFSDKAQFSFVCPATESFQGKGVSLPERLSFSVPEQAVDTLKVSARLLYRKIDQYLLNTLYGEASGVTTPVAEIASDSAVIIVN